MRRGSLGGSKCPRRQPAAAALASAQRQPLRKRCRIQQVITLLPRRQVLGACAQCKRTHKNAGENC